MTKTPVDAVDDRLIRRKAVSAETGLPTSSLYAKIAKGEFPKPVPLGARAVAWRESEVKAWKAGRIAARDRVA